MSEPESYPPPMDVGWDRRRVIFLAISGAVVVGILVWTSDVLLPFILAVLTAYVLTPPVAACEKVKIPRWVSILLVYAVTFSAIYLSIAAVAPRMYEETLKLTRETPALARNLAAKWGPVIDSHARALLGRVGQSAPPPEPEPAFTVSEGKDGILSVHLGSGVDLIQESPRHWRVRPIQQPREFSVARLVGESLDQTVDYIKRNALEVIRVGQVIVSKITRGIFLAFMTLMVAGYLIHTRDDIFSFVRSLPPPSAQPSFNRLVYRIDRGFSGVIRGQLLIMLVNGILSAIGFWLFDLKYWPILAVVAGLMSIIPIFGSILSSVPAVMIGLTQDFGTALGVLLWILGIHQVEANLLNPKIIGIAARLHPVLVVFSLLVGEHFYGLWGALLAVPTLSLLQSIFQHFRFESLPDASPDSIVIQARRRTP